MFDELIKLSNENEGLLQAIAMVVFGLGVVFSTLRSWTNGKISARRARFHDDPQALQPKPELQSAVAPRLTRGAQIPPEPTARAARIYEGPRVKLYGWECGHTFFATLRSVLLQNEGLQVDDIEAGLAIDHPCHACGAVPCIVGEIRA